MSVQLVPLPENPGGHPQLKPPSVLVQTALGAQLSVFRAHSSTSEQVRPSPA